MANLHVDAFIWGSMEISSIEAIPLAHPLDEYKSLGSARASFETRTAVLIRIETNEGTVGWGDASYAPPKTVTSLIEEVISEMLVGMDPFEVRTLAERFHTGVYHFGRSGIFQAAVSGVDIALWDILGKKIGKPVHALLGGSHRSEVTPYASTMFFTNPPTDPAEPIDEAVAEGFNAAKIKIGRGLQDDVHRVRIAREILGDDAYLMVDLNGNYRPNQVIRLANEIEPYGVYWIEEPVPPENLSGYREVKQSVDIALAAGEATFSRYGFDNLIDGGTVDFIQPDVTKCGGLSESWLVAAMATTKNVGVAPHVWTTPVGIAASLQFAASIPEYPHTMYTPEPVFFEYDMTDNPIRDNLAEESFEVEDGRLSIPEGPGLGVTPDLDAIEQYRIDR